MTAPADESGLLKLDECPSCEYSLATLPPEGTCPECGGAYDQRFIVLRGRGRGQWDTPAGGTWRGIVWWAAFAVVLAWLLAGGGYGFVVHRLFVVAWSITAVATVVVAAYVWLFSERQPGMQLWLSPDGFVQVHSTSEARQAQRITAAAGSLALPLATVVYLLVWGGMRLISIGGALLIIVALAGSWVWRRRRAARARAASNDSLGLHPWASVRLADVKSLASGHVRIRLEVASRWVSQAPVADIEVELSDARADRLRELIANWRGRS